MLAPRKDDMSKQAQVEQEQTKTWAVKYHALESKCHREQGALLILWKADAKKNGRSVEDEWKAAGISSQTASRKIRYATESPSTEGFWEWLRRVEPSQSKKKSTDDASSQESTDEDDAPLAVTVYFSDFREALKNMSPTQYIKEVTQRNPITSKSRVTFLNNLEAARKWIDEVINLLEER